MAESNNNYIQILINIGYGFTNFSRLRNLILYISSLFSLKGQTHNTETLT